MLRRCTMMFCLVGLILISSIPVLAQEDYPPECVEDPSLCEEWTTIEEWSEMEEVEPVGGEEYPEECIEDPNLCVDWSTVDEWNEMMVQQDEYPTSNEAVENYQTAGVACPDSVDWSNYAEVRVIQMRAGYSYTATVIGIDGFDPVLAVMDQGGNGLCIDDEPQASEFTVTLPDTGEIPASNLSAQVTFSNNSGEELADMSLYVTSLSGESGEFVVVVEGMYVTETDNAGDPFAVQITPGMVASGISPTAYMISASSELDPYIELIDQNYVTMQDSSGNWILCDDGGSDLCWGDSSTLSDTAYIYSNVYGEWYGGPYDTMLSIPLSEDSEGGFYYTFLMRSYQQASDGAYAAVFHMGI